MRLLLPDLELLGNIAPSNAEVVLEPCKSIAEDGAMERDKIRTASKRAHYVDSESAKCQDAGSLEHQGTAKEISATRCPSHSSEPNDSFDHRMQLVGALLQTCDNRRSALDVRATVLVTIALALMGFILAEKATVFSHLPQVLMVGVSSLVVFFAILSLSFSLRTVAPLHDDPSADAETTNSVTYPYHISDQPVEEYCKRISALSRDEVLCCSAKQIYELSGVLRQRYDALTKSSVYLWLSIITLLVGTASDHVCLLMSRLSPH